MTHKNVFETFCKLFPGWRNSVDVWFEYGNSTIKIRMKNRAEYIFTYRNDLYWIFETIQNFKKRSGKK